MSLGPALVLGHDSRGRIRIYRVSLRQGQVHYDPVGRLFFTAGPTPIA